MDKNILITQLVLGGFGVLCNIAGIIAIYSYHKKTNQNIILAYISVSEILYTICVNILLIITENDSYGLLSKILRSLQWCFGAMLVVGMHLLTVDRMVCIINPLRYETRLTRKRTKMILVVGNAFSFAAGVFVFIMDYLEISIIRYLVSILISVNIIFIVFCLVTYSMAFYTVRKSNREFHGSVENERKRLKKVLLIPGILISTYIVFYIIPYIIDLPQILNFEKDYYNRPVREIVVHFGLIADPLTYIFFAKHYRGAFLKKIRCCFGQESLENTSSDVIRIDANMQAQTPHYRCKNMTKI